MSPENEIVHAKYAILVSVYIGRPAAFVYKQLGVWNRKAGFLVERKSDEAAEAGRFGFRRVHRRTKEPLREKLTGVGLKSPAADQCNQGEPEYAKARQDSSQYAS